jgi:hypothetical protein
MKKEEDNQSVCESIVPGGIGAAFRDFLEDMLDRAIRVDGAAKGNIQIFDSESGNLIITAQKGFDGGFLDSFRIISSNNSSTSCTRALKLKQRVVVSNVDADPAFSPYRTIAHASGFRAVQSTPILCSNGSIFGVLSTHYARPHLLSPEAERELDECARDIAMQAERI